MSTTVRETKCRYTLTYEVRHKHKHIHDNNRKDIEKLAMLLSKTYPLYVIDHKYHDPSDCPIIYDNT
jgi:hypothetical protein